MAVFVGDAGGTRRLDAGLIGHELDVHVPQRFTIQLDGSFDRIVEDEHLAATAGG